jgi:peroxiredoxin/uncharacterized protein YcnI
MNMKYSLILLLVCPFLAFSQVKQKEKTTTTKVKTKTKTATPKKEEVYDGFIIKGEVTGYPDGTSVSFLNRQTNVPEKQTTITANKFEIKGKMDQPAFKILLFNDAQPDIPIFLDNSIVTVKGDRNSPAENFVITGSPSHTQFAELAAAIKPYERVFASEDSDSANVANAAKVTEDFAIKYPNSYITPLAIIRYYQATQNGQRAEQLYNALPASLKGTEFSLYLNQILQEGKINAIGTTVADFSQADTTGKQISISSFRGKYVLIDFWASWCRPCRAENPNVVEAYNKFKDKNFTILSVSLDKSKDSWIDAIKMDNLTWTHVSDLQGWANAVSSSFHIQSIPQNILIDPNGKIIAKNLRGSALDMKLAALLR